MEIKKLRSFLDSSPHLREAGITIGQGGDAYSLLDFDPTVLTIEGIASSLSKQARYLGNTNGFYSVAQHCCSIAHAFLIMGDLDKAMQGLMHDASEAFISDISSPLKRLLQKETKSLDYIEQDIDQKIAAWAGCTYPWSQEVMAVDKNMAALEMEIMMLNDKLYNDYWDASYAEQMYIEMYNIIKHMMSIG